MDDQTRDTVAIVADGASRAHTHIQAIPSHARIPQANRAQSTEHLALSLRIIASRIPVAGPAESKTLAEATDLLASAIQRRDFIVLTTSLDLFALAQVS